MTTMILPNDELILPKHLDKHTPTADAAAEVAGEALDEPTALSAGTAAMLPAPVGFKLLCAVPEAKRSYDSGIVKAAETIMAEETGTTVLFVLAVGPDAYGDKARFPSGPWCQKGDFVLVRTYSGSRFKVFDKEFRVINDDQVECTVSDPRGITRFSV